MNLRFEDSFQRNLWLSVALHVALVLLFVIKAAWLPSDDLLIRSALRVDLVGMPDKVQTVSEPAPEPAVAKPEPVKPVTPKVEPAKPPKVALEKKPEKAPDLKKSQETQKKAMERLKALQAIDKLKGEVSDREANQKPKEPTFKGNMVNSGDSLTGLERIEYDRYFATIENQVKSNWNLPGWLAEAQLRAQALVMIDAGGQVVRRQVVRPSGNEVFDAQVLAAIDRSAPFPKPPSRLKDVLALKGIVFNFPD